LLNSYPYRLLVLKLLNILDIIFKLKGKVKKEQKKNKNKKKIRGKK